MVDVRSLPKFGPRVKKHATANVERSEKEQIPTAKETPNTKLQAPEKTQAPTPKPQAAGRNAPGVGLIQRVMGSLKKLIARSSKGVTRPVPQPVQGELSLDNVKVMRNDLSDSDFEVVSKPAIPHKPAAEKPIGKPVEQGTKAAAPAETKRIWNRVSTLIGAGHS